MFVIETERLMMREMTDSDTEQLMNIFSDPIAMQYYPSTKTREDAERWIYWNLENYQKHGHGLWICERKEDGQFVGQCGIVPQIVDGGDESEIGYLFARKYWGKGYATEAAMAAKMFGFNKLGKDRLISMIYIHNLPSIRVAERNGMELEKQILVKGRDTLIYSVKKQERGK